MPRRPRAKPRCSCSPADWRWWRDGGEGEGGGGVRGGGGGVGRGCGYSGTCTWEGGVRGGGGAGGGPALGGRLDRDLPYPAERVRSVTLLYEAGRLWADITAEV